VGLGGPGVATRGPRRRGSGAAAALPSLLALSGCGAVRDPPPIACVVSWALGQEARVSAQDFQRNNRGEARFKRLPRGSAACPRPVRNWEIRVPVDTALL